MDLPKGFVRGVKGDHSDSDYTQWTVFKDLTHRIIYFKSYQDSALKKIDLSKLNLSKGAKQKSIPVASKQIYVNMMYIEYEVVILVVEYYHVYKNHECIV